MRRPNRAVLGADSPRLDGGGRRALIDTRAVAFDDGGESAREPGRVNRGAVRRVQAADYPVGTDARSRLVTVEEPVVVVAETPRVLLGHRPPDPLELDR